MGIATEAALTMALRIYLDEVRATARTVAALPGDRVVRDEVAFRHLRLQNSSVRRLKNSILTLSRCLNDKGSRRASYTSSFFVDFKMLDPRLYFG